MFREAYSLFTFLTVQTSAASQRCPAPQLRLPSQVRKRPTSSSCFHSHSGDVMCPDCTKYFAEPEANARRQHAAAEEVEDGVRLTQADFDKLGANRWTSFFLGLAKFGQTSRRGRC